jgi:hypothetical protein
MPLSLCWSLRSSFLLHPTPPPSPSLSPSDARRCSALAAAFSSGRTRPQSPCWAPFWIDLPTSTGRQTPWHVENRGRWATPTRCPKCCECHLLVRRAGWEGGADRSKYANQHRCNGKRAWRLWSSAKLCKGATCALCKTPNQATK